MREDHFERLYAKHAEPLLAFLVYRTGDRPLSEDLVADTFERALTARRPFNPRRASEKTWLYTIALNVLRDDQRRAAVGKRSLERVTASIRDAASVADLEAVAHRDELQRALATLTLEEREAIALRYGADLTVSEIAKLIKEKDSTVHGRIYRSLRKLSQALGPPSG